MKNLGDLPGYHNLWLLLKYGRARDIEHGNSGEDPIRSPDLQKGNFASVSTRLLSPPLLSLWAHYVLDFAVPDICLRHSHVVVS